jgi:hypothetical protein
MPEAESSTRKTISRDTVHGKHEEDLRGLHALLLKNRHGSQGVNLEQRYESDTVNHYHTGGLVATIVFSRLTQL